MKNSGYLAAYIISNAVALLLLLAAGKRKETARLFYALIFFGASLVNWFTCRARPDLYLNYAGDAIGPYRDFIEGPFSQSVTAMVSLIAIYQFLTGILFLGRGISVKFGCVLGFLFLVAIAPLGWGSAFPSSLIMAGGLFFLYRHSFEKDIFGNRWIA